MQFSEAVPELVHLASTSTTFSGVSWTYLLAAELTSDVDILPSDMGLTGVDCVAIEYFDDTETLFFLNDTTGLHIEKMGTVLNHVEVPFAYYIVRQLLLLV